MVALAISDLLFIVVFCYFFMEKFNLKKKKYKSIFILFITLGIGIEFVITYMKYLVIKPEYQHTYLTYQLLGSLSVSVVLFVAARNKKVDKFVLWLMSRG